MEPVLIASALTKLIGLGLSISNALRTEGIGKEEAELVQTLLDAGIGLAAHQRPDEPHLAARHLAIICRAFGEAFRRQWYQDRRFAPGRGWFEWLRQNEVGRNRMRQIERRTAAAATKLVDLGGSGDGDQLAKLDDILGNPLGTPYYTKLYQAFTDDDQNEPGEERLITNRLQFERDFRLAFAEALSTNSGEELRRYLLALAEDRASVIRELMIRDLTGWGSRHVFGNAAEHSNLPLMPLGAIYVEPNATHEQDTINLGEAPSPILDLLERLYPLYPIVVVSADFGYGKSLTARMLAWKKAQLYVQDNKPSPEIFRPVYVKCAEDFESHTDELGKILKRAEWRLARALGLDVALEDPAFDQPWSSRTLYLIDGFDEVALGEKETRTFFQRMKEKASSRCRFIVFTRPAVLERSDYLEGVPILRLQPFSTHDYYSPGGQVERWLRRWCAFTDRSTALTATDLDAQGLLGVASTPILLFMIAFTWEDNQKNGKSLSDIYESFFYQIARGKHQQDYDRNRPIAEASEQLLSRLRELGVIDVKADAPQAMLWLMSRVAWKAKCIEDTEWLEGRKRALERYDLQKILKEELDIEGDPRIERTIHIGLLLALQADLQQGDSRILFGHQSFREYLIARYWAIRLRNLITITNRDWERNKNEPLLQGSLDSGMNDPSFKFLTEQVNAWTDTEREQLFRWAEECFNDERLAEGVSTLREDRRPLLREAALAIGSATQNRGVHAKHQWSMRSLLAWFWLQGRQTPLFAPRLRAPLARLAGAYMVRADLRGADLRGADLREARLDDSNLCRANLCDANLENSSLSSANLEGTNMNGATLRGAWLSSAILRDAQLNGADMISAQLNDVDLTDADMRKANLDHASLEETRFIRADLRGASLRGAHLRGAHLTSANLSYADLSYADLSDAFLSGAVLKDAVLNGTNLRGALYHPSQLAGANTEGVLLRNDEEEFASEEDDD